jgi:hypothetical protein
MYVCFNHPLADTMAQLAPAQAQVNTFHGYCVDAARQMGVEPDFTHSGIFTTLAQSFMERSQAMEGTVELLIIDEAQDFDADWVQALLGHLAPQGRVYVLGDSQQDVYDKEAFDLPDAVHVQCMDNFRSPRKVVAAINSLHLAEQPIKACSAHEGVAPGFHTYANHDDPQKQTKVAGAALDACLKQLWADGFAAQDVALVTFAGAKHSPLLQGGRVDGYMLRAFTGTYDTAGNEIWTVGPLRAESLYRFKGQSAPVVVLCEVDFASVTPKVLRKLFVGFTRAQFRLEIVLSERAAAGLLERA